VCPVGLIDHWECEIEKHLPDTFKVYIFYGPRRKKDIEYLKKYDIILTSYHTLVSDNKKRFSTTSTSTLQKIKWYRVIIDEANTIKNRETAVFKEVNNLDCTYRWCLTGTPIENSLWDIFSLLYFIRVYGSIDNLYFKLNIVDPITKQDNEEKKRNAFNRLKATLLPVLLQRKKTSLINGEPIIKIPEIKYNNLLVELTSDELLFITNLTKHVESFFQELMNQGRRAISKAMMYLLELLLRLRQCADHIYLYLICNLDARKEDPDFDWRQYIDEIQYRFKNMIEDLKSGKNSVFTNTLNLVMNTKLCYICNDELSPEYLQTKCNHTFCDCCVGESIYLNNECPFCNTKLNSSEIIRHISNKKVVYDDSSDLDISMSGDSFIERDENEKKKSEQRKKK